MAKPLRNGTSFRGRPGPLFSLPQFSGPTVPTVGRPFFSHSPSTILKLDTDDGEGVMTALARSILGSCVPSVVHVTILERTSGTSSPLPAREGLVLTHLPGTPLVELWPSLIPPQQESIKAELCRLLVHMRASRFSYYGRPERRPYQLSSEFGTEVYACCTSRLQWDESRVRALHSSAPNDTERVAALERVQRNTTSTGTGDWDHWDRPVLTHGDLSNRNILVDPRTLAITGLLDWEMANIMPAYFEYVEARLSGGHDPEWRKDILDVLRAVLRQECHAGAQENLDAANVNIDVDEQSEKYRKTLAAWDALVDVERSAQGYDDNCYWTFETGLPDARRKTDSAL